MKNNLHGMLRSDQSIMVCVARGYIDYNKGTSVNGSGYNAAKYADLGRVTLEKLVPGMTLLHQYGSAWKCPKYSFYVHSTGGHCGTWGGSASIGRSSYWGENDSHIWAENWRLTAGNGSAYSSNWVSGRLYILIFAPFLDIPTPVTPKWGMQMFNSNKQQSYNTHYMPHVLRGLSDIPPYSLDVLDWNNGIAPPDTVEPARLPAVPPITLGAASRGQTGTTLVTYYDPQNHRVSARSAGTMTTSQRQQWRYDIYGNSKPQFKVPIIHAADYF
ncbi:hypothetical protein [Vibrio nomapromontoriensis]|uniref:hypothetical protein n=1 Tax=Vibrio nomapromontoriensis TaxID=2910246 RepID=UPI003D0E52B9